MRYEGWMIELVDGRGMVGWWRGCVEGEDSLSAWTKDPNAAIKFVHESDARRAMAVWGLTSEIHKATSHVWILRKYDALPSYDEIRMMLPSLLANGSEACPICGNCGVHEHSPSEIVIYRNGMKAGRPS